MTATATRSPVLSVQDLVVDYATNEAAFRAVEGASVEVEAGEFVAVVGPSGCGKTTMVKAIAGLLTPTSGHVRMTYSGDRVPFAMVFQSSSLFPWRTVRRNITYGMESLGKRDRPDKAEMRRKTDELLDLVGLADSAERYPSQLSGGMQQRVNLARALAVNPELLLLDEPFAALDAQMRERMQADLERIWLKSRTAGLLITHQVDEAVFLADKVVIMGPGPGRVVRVLDVDLPRPRSLELKRTSIFGGLVDEVWHTLGGPDRSGAEAGQRTKS